MNNNIPEVRFRGYSNSWKSYKLKNLATYSNGGSYEKDVTSNGDYELITLKSVDMQGNLVCSGKYINKKGSTLNKGTLVMILSEQSPGLLGMTTIIPEDNRYILNQRVAEISPNKEINSYFLSMALNKNQRFFSRLGAGTKVQNISKYNVENFAIHCPKSEEQTEIGTFFKLIDEKIQLNQHALNLLKQRKKAFLQKMFPKNGESNPELRFSGCSEEWELKQLKEIVSYSSSKHSSNHFKNNKFEGLYPVFDANKIIAKIDSFDMEERYLSIIKDGAGVGRLSKRPAKSSIIGTMGYLSAKKSSIDFIHAMLTKFEFRKFIVGSTIPHVYFKDYGVVKVHVPSLKEQEKIGKFFKELDNSITLQEEKIESLKQMKKAFLQKMFV